MINILTLLVTAVLSFLVFVCPCFSASEVVVKGVASPQNQSEVGNLEKLRQRAIRNAMDLAVMQVTGALISGERGDSIRFRDNMTIQGDIVEEFSQQHSQFRAAATSRSEGHAQLIEIIKEWQENGQYFIEAKISVESWNEMSSIQNAGYFWQQAGKPSIRISLVEDFNGESNQKLQDRTLSFLRDNLIRNGVMVSFGKNITSQYRIDVLQTLLTEELANLGTFTIHCRLSYQIIDQDRGESVAEYRVSNGPVAGFSEDQAKDGCLKTIAPDLSEKLVRALGGIMNDRWNNGVEQQVIITDMPEKIVASASEILQNIYRITYATPASYSDGEYRRTMRFIGSGTDFAQAIQSAFADEDWNIKLSRIEGGKIFMKWIVAN